MKSILLVGMLAMAGVSVPIVSADIYFWTDENGVKNFTNFSPPEKAELFMETSEIDEETALLEAETNRTGDMERDLESERLQAVAAEIEALREQVTELENELNDRIAPLPEAPPIEAGDAAAEEEGPAEVRYGSGYLFWPYPYGYPPYGYKGYHKPRPRHGYVRPGYKKQSGRTSGLKIHGYVRQPSRAGHGSVGQRSGHRSFQKSLQRNGFGRPSPAVGSRGPGVGVGRR